MFSIAAALYDAKKALATQHNAQDAQNEAHILLCHAINKNKAYLYTHTEEYLTQLQYETLQQMIAKRLQGEPIAYIIGKKAFWTREFIVTKDVLIPRPETELLIELILKYKKNEKNLAVLDLGTGSGIIAITIALERPDWEIFAVERSKDAIAIAKKNSICFNADRIKFLIGNWTDSITNKTLFDVIVSNPPYVAEADEHLTQGDLKFEPQDALSAKNAGLQDLFIIIEQSLAKLKKNGLLLLEHGFNQAAAVSEKLRSTGFSKVQTFKDLQGLDRVTIGCLI